MVQGDCGGGAGCLWDGAGWLWGGAGWLWGGAGWLWGVQGRGCIMLGRVVQGCGVTYDGVYYQ